MHGKITDVAKHIRASWRLRGASKIQTHMTPDEKMTLFQMAIKSGPIAVEVGSYLGASSCYIAAAQETKKAGRLYCIDTWMNDAMTEGACDTFQAFLFNTRKFSQTITTIRGQSTDCVASFADTINFLFLDANHSYDGIKSDWDNWRPFLEPDAVVVLHDTGWAEGVKRVLAEDVAPVTSTCCELPNMFCGRYQPK